MRITLKLFATLSRYLPMTAQRDSRQDLELPAGTSVGELIQAQGLPAALCTMVLVNGSFVPTQELATRILDEGDVVAIWPPVGGG